MAVARMSSEHEKPVTEQLVVDALSRRLEWMRQTMCPNLMMFGWEMDMCLLTRAGLVHEYEVKISMGDWNADQKKDKWHPERSHNHRAITEGRKKISRFNYVVSEAMASRIPAWVPVKAGIWAYGWRGGRLECWCMRTATKLGGYKVSDAERMRVLTGVYFRYWRITSKVELKECVCHPAEVAFLAPGTDDPLDPES